MLDGVYVDAKEDKRIVGIKPKPPFRPVFQVATTKEGSGVEIMKEPPVDSPEAPCLWWRRGRNNRTQSRTSIRVLERKAHLDAYSIFSDYYRSFDDKTQELLPLFERKI